MITEERQVTCYDNFQVKNPDRTSGINGKWLFAIDLLLRGIPQAGTAICSNLFLQGANGLIPHGLTETSIITTTDEFNPLQNKVTFIIGAAGVTGFMAAEIGVKLFLVKKVYNRSHWNQLSPGAKFMELTPYGSIAGLTIGYNLSTELGFNQQTQIFLLKANPIPLITQKLIQGALAALYVVSSSVKLSSNKTTAISAKSNLNNRENTSEKPYRIYNAIIRNVSTLLTGAGTYEVLKQCTSVEQELIPSIDLSNTGTAILTTIGLTFAVFEMTMSGNLAFGPKGYKDRVFKHLSPISKVGTVVPWGTMQGLILGYMASGIASINMYEKGLKNMPSRYLADAVDVIFIINIIFYTTLMMYISLNSNNLKGKVKKRFFF